MAGIDSKALAKAMDLAGITSAQLARELGVSTSYVARIAAGSRRLKRNPVLRRRIADAIGVPARLIEDEAA
jgi:transcriptional regulator with XRE-family HTH domain